jgi:hypothetical protein
MGVPSSGSANHGRSMSLESTNHGEAMPSGLLANHDEALSSGSTN